eukprot:CAMPEP_0197644038 /NCGR_PEP_ID=MMETSP1338-20131121/17148_1 /TAXON_ID=43686 ORGANISM="Pelagodinium beii, Strain RCC1491" /NCGR_SAMPLE_ID=MMETSP1338 /ASSEMBLY_ACC=CAM_ASM_000754 /LENGTH=107 /DNA_ID=CAMNT_0043217359 /DNA_START=100 /DNA_END=423 /DNA_ORIENTATION=-
MTLSYSSLKVMIVDLSDLADFIKAVQNSFVFATCISRCTFSIARNGMKMKLNMTDANWSRIAEAESDLTRLALNVQTLQHQVTIMQETTMTELRTPMQNKREDSFSV